MARILNIKKKVPWLVDTSTHGTGNLLEEQQFSDVLYRERKRAERSGEYIFLVLLDLTKIIDESDLKTIIDIYNSLLEEIRDTDACGWLKQNKSLGIVFTGISNTLVELSAKTVELKIWAKLNQNVEQKILKQLKLEVLFFPDKKQINEGNEPEVINSNNYIFYPELFQNNRATKWSNQVKRCLDIVGSIFALILFSPVFLIVPVFIKLTSRGPIFFKQERVGKFGKRFSFLKFRSMHVNNDDSIHRQFIKGFIDNKLITDEGNEKPVFKIKNDPRLTPIGNFLRKTSLDEFPQFINVLRGDMSLVGPRPPIPYEVVNYGTWHWYRILAKKPGITGLWQVQGRSLTTFDGMVRLDLQYIRTWSLWLDIKLLLATPMAVLRGKGAY
ncbi:MAG TPA: sugar transferase [Negativicutes bacterium]|jgi:exopolysaccharide biosynthesis polyprenyl glycosylphosphotransferase